MLKVGLLGTGGTMPLPGRNLTAMISSCNGKMILIDCGEGTQVALKSLGWGIKNIDIICLTHYHPDHVVGLPGLLSTVGNSGREEEITIIGPKGLKEVVEGFMVILPYLPYPIKLIEIPENGLCDMEHGKYIINAIYVEHSIECAAYSIKVRRNRKFDAQKAKSMGIPVKFWSRLQKGEIVYENEICITPEMVLGDERKGLKISYSTDTRPTLKIVDFVRSSDLFICEGMYGDDSYITKAEGNKHMLFSEAAKISKDAEVKEMWLTHFSPCMNKPQEYIENAKNIFKNSKIGEDLMCKEFKFEK